MKLVGQCRLLLDKERPTDPPGVKPQASITWGRTAGGTDKYRGSSNEEVAFQLLSLSMEITPRVQGYGSA